MGPIGWVLVAVVGAGPPARPVDYLRDVRPILAARCASCHGAVRQKAGLRLDTAALALKGGDGGPAVVPGKSAESPLIERVTSAEPGERMPPESEGVPLSADEVAALRAWVDRGAPAPAEVTPPDPRDHWAFRAPVRPPVPRPANPEWAVNPVDAFLSSAHAARGLTPAPPLRRDLWLRRVTLDLIGLPPTREELHAFLDDRAPGAEGRVVDRLLADPRHGERWGRHWMDVWRYSDWYGLGAEIRYSHPHVWRWRDWVVASLNADKGYDRMVVEMLAGDELAPGDPETLRATGYLVRSWDIFNRNVWLANTVEHASRAFLGLTVQCARCHDHKYDPISQAEYYKLRAFFEPVHVRVDPLPGEPDRAKGGVSRVFDDFLDAPTYRFIRGDEARPDKSRPLPPATPAVLGGEVTIAPRSLSLAEAWPDKRGFVIRAAADAAEAAVASARKERDAAEAQRADAAKSLRTAEEADAKALDALGAAKPNEVPAARDRSTAAVEVLARARAADREAGENLEVAGAALALADARRAAIRAVLVVERVEDEGGKSSDPHAWAEAARTASTAQRAEALAAARHGRAAARRDVGRFSRALDALTHPGPAGLKGDPLRGDRTKAAADLGAARLRLRQAESDLAKAEAAAKTPADTKYTPRPLAFPRAKLTYRDEPSTAPYPRTTTGRRLALANWLVDRANPLAARVAVNHVWARHFGEPLTGSTDDFGLRTPRPELQPLLDWLAVELMESDWSLKHLHRLIVTSQAYRMHSAHPTPASNAAVDPDNRLFWRMNPRRMEGEVVRDSVLALAGKLDPALGGPEKPVADAEKGTRRTIYYRYANGDRIPLLTTFDGASVEECYRRHETVVPQQALALSNSAMVLTRAGEVASALDRALGGGATRQAFVAAAFEHVLNRPPTDSERDACVAGLERLAAEAVTAGAKPGTAAESAARAALAHVLLNHNDFVTIR